MYMDPILHVTSTKLSFDLFCKSDYISFQKSLLPKPFYKLLGLSRSWIKQLLLIILRYTQVHKLKHSLGVLFQSVTQLVVILIFLIQAYIMLTL